jgi:hypothetical protein
VELDAKRIDYFGPELLKVINRPPPSCLVAEERDTMIVFQPIKEPAETASTSGIARGFPE